MDIPTRDKKQACLLNCSFESTVHSGLATNSSFFSNGYSKCATSALSLYSHTAFNVGGGLDAEKVVKLRGV